MLEITSPKNAKASYERVSQYSVFCETIASQYPLYYNVCDRITIIILFHSLDDELEATATNILKQRDKIIDIIKRILILTKAKLIEKRINKVIGKLAMTT